jgi:hypothetical protein
VLSRSGHGVNRGEGGDFVQEIGVILCIGVYRAGEQIDDGNGDGNGDDNGATALLF